ncbi:MAG: aminopeptidase P family protein [Spirochaetales bacterium]|nr:aminopeptidase P family protein [Spirochaetales bacterium]
MSAGVLYPQRRQRATDDLRDRGVDLAYLTADADVRYLTGMPYGSVLFLFASGRSILLPWDELLARKTAQIDEILPYTDFGRDLVTAVTEIAGKANLKAGSTIEIPSDTGHLRYAKLKDSLEDYRVLCRAEDLSSFISRRRMVKDAAEIAVLRRACAMTDQLIGEVTAGVTDGSLRTEADVAVYLEGTALARGAEKMGFETIAAGPERSYGIHAHPACTAAKFGTPGLSILDFGVNREGYTSDVTLTFARGPMNDRQELMILLVEKAYEMAAAMANPGTGTHAISTAVDELFARDGFSMPHGLGHGIGLEIHEAPFLKSNRETGVILEPGMIFTLEPGLYDRTAGGVRLENDFLITESGHEVLTTSRLIRLP